MNSRLVICTRKEVGRRRLEWYLTEGKGGKEKTFAKFSFSQNPHPCTSHTVPSLIFTRHKRNHQEKVRNSITGVDVRSSIVWYCLLLCFEVCVWSRHLSLSSLPRRRSLGFVTRSCSRMRDEP